MNLDKTRAALRYIRAIRNPAKQAYANYYQQHIAHGAPMPPDSAFRLGGMARQAVRMSLDDIYAEAE